MSEHFLKVIPTVPGWAPDETAGAAARDTLARLCPDADGVTTGVTDVIEFVDPGEGFESVRCPACGQVLDMDWWSEEMTRAHAGGYADISLVTACCSTTSTLNDLAYDWPAGLARCVVAASGPGRGWLTDEELDEVSSALGHPVRQILTMY